MVLLNKIGYYKPDTLEEAIAMHTAGWDWRILAGGTDLIVKLKDEQNFAKIIKLIDIKGLEFLKNIKETKNGIEIGSLVTFTDILDSTLIKDKFPILWEAASTVASTGIRNRATLAGNICSAVPSLDSGPSLLILEAKVIVHGVNGSKEINIENWFTGPKETALMKKEIVTGIFIPFINQKHGSCYVKLGRYSGEDLAQAGLGVLVTDNFTRIAVCAVGPIPKRVKKVEDLLKGKILTDDILEEIKEVIKGEISPITDIRASKEYRTHMIKIMLERGLKEATKRLNNKNIGAIKI